MTHLPLDIKNLYDQEILITWNDGHRSLYSQRTLRFLCPCAQCVDERTGDRIIELEHIAQNIHSLEISLVGSYAVKFRWSDLHDTGIYGFEYLRSKCPCKICQK